MALALVGAAFAQTDSSYLDQQQPQQQPERYEGPTILSRDRSLIGERSGKLLDYRYYGSVTGVYDTELLAVGTTSNGALSPVAGAGVEAGFGVTGSRTWKRDKLSLDYNGVAREYPNARYFDGIDQFLNLSYEHQYTHRLSVQLRETAGTLSLGVGYFTFLPLQQTDLFVVPTNELFDNRTDFLQTRADVIYYLTPRLSIDLGGEGFYVRRRSASLASLNGYEGHGDVSYRLTRRQTATISYERVAFNYLRLFGDAYIDTYTGGYSIGLGRRWDFALQAGAAHVDFSGLTVVNIDPAIAAIVGQNTAVVTFHNLTYIPIYQAQLTRRFPHSAVTAAYNQAFSPGNGVYLTARQTAATLQYSYTGLKRFTFAANASYSSLSSLGQTLGSYRGTTGGIGVTYKVASATHLEARYDYRYFTTGITGFNQNASRLSVGLAFSPGEKPLPIW